MNPNETPQATEAQPSAGRLTETFCRRCAGTGHVQHYLCPECEGEGVFTASATEH